ncbi:MAG: hypothetical protein ACREDE_10785, partial [Thermoplasmata archaeon]
MTEPAPLPRIAAVAGVVAAGVLPLGIVLATPLLASPYPGLVLFLSGLGTFALAYRWRLHRETSFLAVWVGVGLVLAVVSIVTGRWNGLTDEPYGTPAFAGLWPNLYGSPLHLVYHQYGSGPYDLVSYYVYLPLLAFVQVPSLDYRWVALGAWALAVWFVRRSGAAVTLLAAPWVALLAASGFNDFVPLAALSAAFAGLAGWRSRVAEVVSLALKQFANVIVVAYHLWRREWREALLAGAITALILAPFAYWSPSGVWCHAVLLTTGPGCSGSSGFSSAVSLVGHLNYLLWPTWLLAVFGARYVTR